MRITIIPEEYCIEAGGIKYSFELFGNLGRDGFPDGTYFQLVRRDDGMLTITRYDPPREGGDAHAISE